MNALVQGAFLAFTLAVVSCASCAEAEVQLLAITQVSNEDHILPLDVTINGSKVGTWLFIEHQAMLYVQREALEEWRIVMKNDAKSIDFKDQKYWALGNIDGYKSKINLAEQSVDIQFSPESFETTRFKDTAPAQPKLSPVLNSVFFNYDVNYSKSYLRAASSVQDVSALTEFGLSSNWGVLTTSASGRNLTHEHALGNKSQWLRLESTFTKDFPEENHTLWIGDSTTKAGMLGRNIYFGGVRYGTNFSLSPGYVSQPLQALTGISATPSTVELYINDVLRQFSNVPAGPFAIENFPILTGSGDARIVVRDLLGRETVIQKSFFTDSQLLATGLNDWSVEAGSVRDDLGTSNANYGPPFISGLWRRGMSENLTLEGRTAITSKLHLLQLGAVTTLPFQLIGRGAVAASQANESGNGQQWLLGLQHQGLHFGASFEIQKASNDFRELGQDILVKPIKLQLAGNLSYATNTIGSLSFGYAKIQQYQSPTITTLSANYSLRVGKNSSLIVNASEAITPNLASRAIGMTLVIPLENNRTVSLYNNNSSNQNDIYALYSQNPDEQNQLGWRVLAGQQQNHAKQEVGLYYYGRYGTLTGDISHSPDQNALRISANGGLITTEGQLFATQRLTNSFALVEVKDYKDIGVGIGNNILTKTNAKGVALIPRLSAYQSNYIRLNPQDLPISAELDSIEREVVPAWRSGAKVTFPVRSGRGALLRIKLDDGEPSPLGAVVNIEGDKQEFYVARRGEVFVTGLQTNNHLQLHWKNSQCRFDVTLAPENPDEIPRLSPLLCSGIAR